MNPDKIYQELKILAGKFRIKVLEKNFKPAGIRVRSGCCKIRNEEYCLVDKHLKMSQKVDILANALSKLPHEKEEVMPEVRDILNQYKCDTDDAIDVSAATEASSTHQVPPKAVK